MNFTQLFSLIKPRITWFDDDAYWICQGCSVKLDKPSKEIHWPLNCSLSKLKTLQKIRQAVIEANPELYQKYCQAKGVKITHVVKPKGELKQVPLNWYKKQIENLVKLPINLAQPSGAETEELPPIPLKKLTEKDL